MSLFSGASHFMINGGDFTINHLTQDPALEKRKELNNCVCANGHRSSSRNLDGLTIVKPNEFNLLRELSNGNGYRLHPAVHEGHFVAVKTFEGSRAKQNWTADVAFHKEFDLHPNVLKIVGISDESSKKHFILFRGIASDQKMELVIAKGLRTDLDTSALLSMKAVKGIAAGLSYIMSQNIPINIGTTDSNQKCQLKDIDIFSGNDNEPIISFHPSNTICEDGSVPQTSNIENGIGILNGLCEQLFSGANSILYDDSPERIFDLYNDREDLPTATMEYAEDCSNISESEATSVSNPRKPRMPRREVWWNPGATNQSLNSIWWCFERRLNRLLLPSPNSLLRRISSPQANNLRQNVHQCPGYLREEILLTSDVSRSAIVTHTFPNQSELCSICNQLVQYTYPESLVNSDSPVNPEPPVSVNSDSLINSGPPITSELAESPVNSDLSVNSDPPVNFDQDSSASPVYQQYQQSWLSNLLPPTSEGYASNQSYTLRRPNYEPSQSGGISYFRCPAVRARRTPMACMNCRARKLKCRPHESGDRCERCVKEGIPCEYSPVDRGPALPSYTPNDPLNPWFPQPSYQRPSSESDGLPYFKFPVEDRFRGHRYFCFVPLNIHTPNYPDQDNFIPTL